MPDLSKEQRDLFVEKELAMAAEAGMNCLYSAEDSKTLDLIKLVKS